MGFDEATAGLLTAQTTLLEAWGDLVPMTDYPQYDWPSSSGFSGGLVPYTNLSDRQDGRFFPIFYNENDLAQIRGMARRIAGMSPHMTAALTALRTYTMGNGPTVTVTPKAKYAKPDGNSKYLQQLVDAVQEQLDLPRLLEEIHDRSREEGESLSVLHRTGDRIAAEIVEMDGLKEPHVDSGFMDWIRDEFNIDCDSFVPSWTFGVLTNKRMTNIPLGYHVVYDPSGADFEFYPSAQVVHVRRNVPQNVKRGVSDWYPCFDDLRNEAKLGRNMGVSAALQAAIAWIEEYQSGGSAASVGASSPQDVLRSLPTNVGAGGGTRQMRGSHYPPGSIVKVPQNKQYKPGPMGAERNGNFEIAAQYLLRRIGIRHNLPEYMISGDASNGNFASTLVAESPFVKAREADQEYMRRVAKSILWKALALVWEPLTGKPLEALGELKQHYEIKVEFPQVQTRDPLQLAQKLEIEKRNGWVSDQTAMSELGRDPDHEQSLGAHQQTPQSPFGMVGGKEEGQPVFSRRVQESFREEDHPRDKKGQFTDKAASARKSHADRVSKLGGEEVVRMVRKAGVTDDHLKKAGLDLSPDNESIEFEAEQDAKDNAASAKRQAKWYLKGLQKELSRQGDTFTPGELAVSPEFRNALKQSQSDHHTELAQHVADEINRQVGKNVATAKEGRELIRDYGDDPQQLLFGIKSVVDEQQPSLLGQAASTAAKAVSAVLNAPQTIAHAIDDMGTASVANAKAVEDAIHGTGVSPGAKAAGILKDFRDEHTPKTPTNQKRAAVGGEIGPNGEWYNGGAFIATTDMPKKVRQKIDGMAKGKVVVSPGEWEQARPGEMSILDKLGGTVFNHRDGKINYQYLNYVGASESERKTYETLVKDYMAGRRWVPVTEAPELAGIKDAALLVAANQPIPGVLMDKLPALWKSHLAKYTPKITESIHESTLSAALQGALESVETTAEAKAILESIRNVAVSPLETESGGTE